MGFLLENLKRPPEVPRCTWEDNIKMDLAEIGWESIDGIHMVQDRDQWWDLVNEYLFSM
jgi:hypothetical protein